MLTIKEHINNLIESNARHIAELNNEEEVKQWLNSLLWSVVGFRYEINEEELDKLAIESYKEPGYIGEDPLKWYTEGFKAGYHKAKRNGK